MWALKVTRSTMAAIMRGPGNTVPHSLKGRLVAIAMEARSPRSVMIWNSSFCSAWVDLDVAEFVEAEQIEAAVAADDVGEDSFVGGFDELVDQLCGGDVATRRPCSQAVGRGPMSRWDLPVPESPSSTVGSPASM